jgi:rifampicin phosphotransferase
MEYLLDFKNPQACQAATTGGKGSNLAGLTQAGFPVPVGFVVTAQAYRDFLKGSPDFEKSLAQLAVGDPEGLRKKSDRIRETLSKGFLPPGLAGEIRAALKSFPEGTAFSVRSSSTLEDMAQAAFAGQHDTFLNCVGVEMILEKVKACFLSLWHERAVAYRMRQGFDHHQAAMAVVVQKMVFCDVAGVGFSVNPLNGSLQQMVVNANYGLGESVVGGEGEVDHLVLDKRTGSVLESHIGAKTRKVVSKSGGGTVEEELPPREGSASCLEPKKLQELAQILLKVEDHYRFPQDIEWGFKEGRLHLLQSRPITAIPPRWTRDESAERFPNVLTPLAWDFVEAGFHQSLNFSFKRMGLPPFKGKWFARHGYTIYGNQNAVELYGRRDPFPLPSLDALRGMIPLLRDNFGWVQELPVLWMRDLDHYLMRIGSFMAEPLEGKTLPELWAYILEVNRLGTEYFLPNIAISLTQGSLYRFLLKFLKLALGEKEAPALFDALLASCETKTGQINKELWEIAQLIRENPALQKELAATSSRDWLEGGRQAAYPLLDGRIVKFLRDHGHREVDFDPYQPTWLECPWVVLDQLKLLAGQPGPTEPAQKERDARLRMQEAEARVFAKVPADLHFFFSEILRLSRLYTSLDDIEHYQTTRLTLPLRRGLGELGGRLVKRGYLSEPLDVFFTLQAPLAEAVQRDEEGAWKNWARDVRAEKDAYLRDKARTPEWVLGQASAVVKDAGGLTGIAGSPGTAEGTVYQVLGPEDFAGFPKGAVLVAKTTNPAWTPLFYAASAVVTESGGPLSHGAVTAREMSLPAVMSVRGCLDLLKNGQKVKVDGMAGKVWIL